METLVDSRGLSPSGYPQVIDRWAEGVLNKRDVGSVGDGDRDATSERSRLSLYDPPVLSMWLIPPLFATYPV
jgi:hypothetical protein